MDGLFNITALRRIQGHTHMHNSGDDTRLSESALHRMGFARGGNPIRKDSYSLYVGTPKSTLCYADVNLGREALTTPLYKTSSRGFTSLL